MMEHDHATMKYSTAVHPSHETGVFFAEETDESTPLKTRTRKYVLRRKRTKKKNIQQIKDQLIFTRKKISKRMHGEKSIQKKKRKKKLAGTERE